MTGLSMVFLDFLSIFSVALSPVCVKGSGYRIAMIIGILAIISAATTFLSKPIEVTSLEGLASLTWALVAIAMVHFAYTAHRENTLH